jgi:hypothetical protein
MAAHVPECKEVGGLIFPSPLQGEGWGEGRNDGVLMA